MTVSKQKNTNMYNIRPTFTLTGPFKFELRFFSRRAWQYET